MIKDRGQKELLYKHFRAQGWLAQIEVPVISSIGVAAKAPPITDIDVLGIRSSSELRWQYVIGDCKTKKGESPVNRVLWARGLCEAVDASTAIVLLQRATGTLIEKDHKLFADQQGILLLQDTDFNAYDRAIVYPTGSSNWPESLLELELIREGISTKFPLLSHLSRWLLSEAYTIRDHSVLLRRSLVELSDHQGELDPRRNDHLALIIEGAVVFSVAFATLVGTIFRRFTQPDQRGELDEAVRVIVWGGREQFEFYQGLRQQLASVLSDDAEALGLPEWNRFLELIRAFLESPKLAFRIPQFLRRLSIGVMSNRVEEMLANERDVALLQLALRLTEYVFRATKMPLDALEQIRSILIPRITQINESRARSLQFFERVKAASIHEYEEKPAESKSNKEADEQVASRITKTSIQKPDSL